MPNLGLNLKVSGYVVKSTANLREFRKILREVVELVGMISAGKVKTWSFPWYSRFWYRLFARIVWIITGKYLPGAGGVGWTIVQPLVESFAVIDYWREHGHWFLILASCNHYEPRRVANYLSDNCGETTFNEGFTLKGEE